MNFNIRLFVRTRVILGVRVGGWNAQKKALLCLTPNNEPVQPERKVGVLGLLFRVTCQQWNVQSFSVLHPRLSIEQ